MTMANSNRLSRSALNCCIGVTTIRSRLAALVCQRIPQRDGGGEHRQEPVRADQEREPVAHGDDAEAEERFRRLALDAVAQAARDPAPGGDAEQRAERKAARRRPKRRQAQTCPSDPARPAPRPARQGPASTIGNAAPSLSPASPVRPKRKRSRSRSSATCTSPASTGSVGASAPASTSDAPTDRSSTQWANAASSTTVTIIADARKPHRHAPMRHAQRRADRGPGREQRDQHRDLGRALEQHAVRVRVRAKPAEAPRADRHADHEVDERRARRHARDDMARRVDRDQHDANGNEPPGIVHSSSCVAHANRHAPARVGARGLTRVRARLIPGAASGNSYPAFRTPPMHAARRIGHRPRMRKRRRLRIASAQVPAGLARRSGAHALALHRGRAARFPRQPGTAARGRRGVLRAAFAGADAGARGHRAVALHGPAAHHRDHRRVSGVHRARLRGRRSPSSCASCSLTAT